MDLIDDQGRLFGVVNVIDVLVVFFVVAVVVAGVALVDPFATRDQATRYATVDLGTQPDYLVEQVNPGDVMELENSPDNLTITDVYRGPSEDGTQLAVRVRLNGEQTDPGDGLPKFLFGGEPFLVGQELTIETSDYLVTGRVTRVDEEDDELQTATTSVVLQTTVSSSIADVIQPGDTFDVYGNSVATLKSVEVFPTGNQTTKRLVLAATFETRVDGDRRLFAGRVVRLGTNLSFQTAAYDLSGKVIRWNSLKPPGEPTTATVTLRLENVPPERAANIRIGQTETIRGETLARVVGRNTMPAVVILESEGGNVFEREHPRNLDLTLTVELQTRRTSTDLRFHGVPVQIGDTVVLDLGDLTIGGEVTSIDRG